MIVMFDTSRRFLKPRPAAYESIVRAHNQVAVHCVRSSSKYGPGAAGTFCSVYPVPCFSRAPGLPAFSHPSFHFPPFPCKNACQGHPQTPGHFPVPVAAANLSSKVRSRIPACTPTSLYELTIEKSHLFSSSSSSTDFRTRSICLVRNSKAFSLTIW